jgi:hypothetical protein
MTQAMRKDGIDTQAEVLEQHQFDLPTGKLSIQVHGGSWSFDRCMGVGARQNPKRGFLFVSKVLGKHIPVEPSTMLEAHQTLAHGLLPQLDSEPTLFVAMAETATGLGHGVYEACLASQKKALPWIFSTTTRYQVNDHQRVDFTEDHSHATDQWLHLPKTKVPLHTIKTLVLVDDEISTGRTMLNLENSLRMLLPSLERVLWVTLTCLADTTFHPCIYLLKGKFQFEAGQLGEMPGNAVGNGNNVSDKLSLNWGRIGVQGQIKLGEHTMATLKEYASIHHKKGDKPFLVLGQGEFMHASFRVGLELEALGVKCKVQSTTRSPIMVYGAIGCAMPVPDPMGTEVNHYVYNLNPDDYSHIFVVSEKSGSQASAELCWNLVKSSVLVVDL